jgi:heat shock protein HspQ
LQGGVAPGPSAERRDRPPPALAHIGVWREIFRRPKYEGLRGIQDMTDKLAKFRIGQVVRHRVFPFRGVIFDVDPEFSNTEEWYEAIPKEIRPRRDQPFYHLLAENAEAYYVAYVSEQNLVTDESGEPIEHPQVQEMFGELKDGRYLSPKLGRVH